MNTPRVFLSYSYHDQEKAKLITNRLEEAGIRVFADQLGFDIGESFEKRLYSQIESSDFFLLLLSKNSIQSHWVAKELDQAISQTLHYRDITIIPLLLSPARIPTSLKDRTRFDLRRNFDTQIQKLSEYLSSISRVNFESIDPYEFELLCTSLLKKLRFKDLHPKDLESYQSNEIRNKHTDYIGYLRHRDPFGGFVNVNWVFEFKYYQNSRADISSLKELSYYLESLPLNFNGCLITNGILTSTAHEWLRENEKRKRTNIRIVDGIKLKELISKYHDLVMEFFANKGEMDV